MPTILDIASIVAPHGERRLGRLILLTLALWHHRHRSRRHLATLGRRELDDVGLSSAQRKQECRKYFWQD